MQDNTVGKKSYWKNRQSELMQMFSIHDKLRKKENIT